MLSEISERQIISERKTNTVCFQLYLEFKNQNKWTNKTETDSQRATLWVPEGRGLGRGAG